MNKIEPKALIYTVVFVYLFLFGNLFGDRYTVLAREVNLSDSEAIANYSDLKTTNVSQLRDVAPTDWAYQALRSLIERYNCISGFDDRTYRGKSSLSRAEFAAGLNSCLNRLESLIAATDTVSQKDIQTIQRLSREFEAELASLSGKVDEIENRTVLLENNTFSATTKLQGEVVFTLADAFGEPVPDINDNQVFNANDELDVETVFTNRVRLQFASSFTGRDRLITRLSAGNIGNSFQAETNTREGRFAHDGADFEDNNVVVDRLHYSFPVGEKISVTAMAVLAGHHNYAETYNTGLEAGGGATGALTRFGERNPLYRQGIARTGAGIGARYALNDFLSVAAGYVAPNASIVADENGITDGSFSALGQIELTPLNSLRVGITYVRGYDNEQSRLNDEDEPDFRPSFLWGGTGTNLANLRDVEVGSPVATNSLGIQFQFDLNPELSIRGWGGYTDAKIINDGDDNDGSATIFNYAAALVLSDVFKEGNVAALIVGAEPYLTAIDSDGVDGNEAISNDVPIHLEALYKYQLNNNILITPGVIWLSTPNQNDNNEDIFLAALRTTFSF